MGSAEGGDSFLRLPEVAALVGGDDDEAGPDAVADAGIGGRRYLDLVDGAAAAAVQSTDDALLAIEEAIEYVSQIGRLGWLEVERCLGTDARRGFENPRKQAAPEIGLIGRVHLSFARSGAGDDLLPRGKVGVGADVEMLKTLRCRPRGGRGRRAAEVAAEPVNERLESRCDVRELGLEVGERSGPGQGDDCRARRRGGRGLGEVSG